MRGQAGEARHLELGLAGENHADGFFRARGAEIIGRNISFGSGEIDLIVREPDGTHVFVEVKTRRSRAFGGAEVVTPAKRRRLRATAARWLSEREGSGWVPIRFDVLLLVGPEEGDFEAEHFEGI